MRGFRAATRFREMDELLTLDDAERLAEKVVPPDAWGYIAGGAGDERTLRWNREAFSRYRLRPRVLVDVSTVSTETTVPRDARFAAGPRRADGLPGRSCTRSTSSRRRAEPRRPGTVMCLSTVATATPAVSPKPPPVHRAGFSSTSSATVRVSDDVIAEALRGRLLRDRPHGRSARRRRTRQAKRRAAFDVPEPQACPRSPRRAHARRAKGGQRSAPARPGARPGDYVHRLTRALGRTRRLEGDIRAEDAARAAASARPESSC